MINYVYDTSSTIARPNQEPTRKHLTPDKRLDKRHAWATLLATERPFTHLKSKKSQAAGRWIRTHVRTNCIQKLTTKLPSSRMEVYRNSQKSRAGASVVGA